MKGVNMDNWSMNGEHSCLSFMAQKTADLEENECCQTSPSAGFKSPGRDIPSN